MESDSFSETGNLLKRQGTIYEEALSEKCRSDVVLGSSRRYGSSEVRKPMSNQTFCRLSRLARYLGWQNCRALNTSKQILNSILALTGSQCSSMRYWVVGTRGGKERKSLTDLFITDCSFLIVNSLADQHKGSYSSQF